MTDKATKPTTITLAERMLAIINDVGKVPKNGYNSFARYKYATEADISEHLSRAMVTHGVFMRTSTINREECITEIRKTQYVNGKPIEVVKPQYSVTVKIKVDFIAIDTGETYETIWYGDAHDTGDKAIYKAYTGAVKYAQLKTFLIATGDDPEADRQLSPAPHRTTQSAKPQYRAQPPRTQRPPTAPPVAQVQTANPDPMFSPTQKIVSLDVYERNQRIDHVYKTALNIAKREGRAGLKLYYKRLSPEVKKYLTDQQWADVAQGAKDAVV